MSAYWVTFKDRGAACAWAPTDDEARQIANAAGDVVTMEELPYPAAPRLDPYDGWGRGQHPSLCYSPIQCKGKKSCPHRHACSE